VGLLVGELGPKRAELGFHAAELLDELGGVLRLAFKFFQKAFEVGDLPADIGGDKFFFGCAQNKTSRSYFTEPGGFGL